MRVLGYFGPDLKKKKKKPNQTKPKQTRLWTTQKIMELINYS